MSSANFKLKRTAAASRGFLATAGFSCCKFSWEWVIERVLKIGQYVAKLWQKLGGLLFWLTVYINVANFDCLVLFCTVVLCQILNIFRTEVRECHNVHTDTLIIMCGTLCTLHNVRCEWDWWANFVLLCYVFIWEIGLPKIFSIHTENI